MLHLHQQVCHNIGDTIVRTSRFTKVKLNYISFFCKNGKQHKTCSSALCAMDDASCVLVIRLGPKTSKCEKKVTVVTAVTGCDVTNCATTLHGFNKHASSRREAVSDSRGVPRHTEKIYAFSLVSIVDTSTSPYVLLATRLCHSFPSCQLPGELVSLSSVPIPSVDLNL